MNNNVIAAFMVMLGMWAIANGLEAIASAIRLIN